MTVAVEIDQHHHHGFKRFQRCRLQSFTHLDFKIVDISHTNCGQPLRQVAVEVANFQRSVSTPCLSCLATDNMGTEKDMHPKIEIIGGPRPPKVRALVVEMAIAIASGNVPMPISSGLGGAYFLHNRSGQTIAVAKPIDEEPLAFNNPKGFGGLMLGQPGIKRSIRVGETAIRELAAYLLDYNGFAGVPPTALVKISHVAFHVDQANANVTPNYKIASLQNFVSHDFDAGELGPSSFSVTSVHRIGIFDIRILNLDRHAGNILVRKKQQNNNYSVELVPIDHGLCLPEWLDDPYFEWLHWPQALVPFSDSEMEYISNLDPYEDAQLLRTELPSLRESSIRVLVLCTIFLKQAASVGLCLADIGAMMTRQFHGNEENSSVLENLCEKAKASILMSDSSEMSESQADKEVEDDFYLFLFDEDEGITKDHEATPDLPKLLQSPDKNLNNPPKLSPVKSMSADFHAATLSPSSYKEENIDNVSAKKDGVSKSKAGGERAGGLVKSVSFSVENHDYESGGKGISFEGMSQEQWEIYMENFVELLPRVFEDTKRMCATSKHRLGTSCKF